MSESNKLRKLCDQPRSLVIKTRQLIFEDERTIDEIANLANVPGHWLYDFMNKESRSPSVNRIQAVYEALTGKPLLDA